MKAALASVLLVAWLGFSATAQAAPTASLVVLIAEQPGDAVADRLERDLRSMGLSVLVLTATPENSSSAAALEQAARGLGGIAAVRVLSEARGSELWVLEPATGKAVTRSLSRPPGSSADPNEVALGTLELLRASLVELHQPPPQSAPAPKQPPPEPVKAPAPPSAARFSLAGGLAIDLGLRSVGPSLTTLWAGWLRVGGCFGVRGFVSLPVLVEQADVPEGHVEVEPTLLGVGVICRLARTNAAIAPRVSLGFVGARVETRGTAREPFISSSDAVWLGGGYGLLGLQLRLSSDLRLNVDAMGVLLPSPAVIVVSGREAGTWGAPGGLLSVGLEVLSDG